MNKKSLKELNKFYQALDTSIIRDKKNKSKSILLSFLSITSNGRYKLLNDSSIPAYKFSSNIIDELQNMNLIRETDILNNYVITANGIWEIETKTDVLNINDFLNHLDIKYFNFDAYKESNKQLTEKVKVILFSMLAARALSEKSTADFKKNDTVTETWKDITDKSYYKLKKMGIITKLEIDTHNSKSLYGAQGADYRVINLYRHTDDLHKLTKGIYKASGDLKYLLNISDNPTKMKEELKYLFKLVIGDKQLSNSEIDEIYDFCCDVAHNKGIYVFEPEEHIFSKSMYDEIIKDTLIFM